MSAPDLRRIVDVAPLVQVRRALAGRSRQRLPRQIDARPELNAFITRLDEQRARRSRGARRERSATASYRGPLHGIPIAVKDLIDVAGTQTTSGSAVPARRCRRATRASIARLRDAGAIIIGKTNLHEFAFGTTSDESAFGPVRHPLDPSRSAGGSSGGSAAALAAGMCFGALGTDTGGSIRIPSAACGTVGLKPTLRRDLDAGRRAAEHDARSRRTDGAQRRRRGHPLRRAEGPAAVRHAADRDDRLVSACRSRYFCDRLDAGARQALERARAGARRPPATTSARSTSRTPPWTPDVYLHIVLPEASRFHAPWLESLRPTLFARRAPAAGDGPLHPGRGLRPRHAICASALTAAVDRALEGCMRCCCRRSRLPRRTLGAPTVEIDGTDRSRCARRCCG